MGLTSTISRDNFINLLEDKFGQGTGFVKAGKQIYNPDTDITYNITELQKLAINNALPIMKEAYDAGIETKDTVNQNWINYVAAEALKLIGENAELELKVVKLLKRKKGSMIDEPVKQQTTAEVLQELKGLRN